jgi:hypothetical protein
VLAKHKETSITPSNPLPLDRDFLKACWKEAGIAHRPKACNATLLKFYQSHQISQRNKTKKHEQIQPSQINRNQETESRKRPRLQETIGPTSEKRKDLPEEENSLPLPIPTNPKRELSSLHIDCLKHLLKKAGIKHRLNSRHPTLVKLYQNFLACTNQNDDPDNTKDDIKRSRHDSDRSQSCAVVPPPVRIEARNDDHSKKKDLDSKGSRRDPDCSQSNLALLLCLRPSHLKLRRTPLPQEHKNANESLRLKKWKVFAQVYRCFIPIASKLW